MKDQASHVKILKCLTETEMNIKNSLYSFILEKGLFFELQEYELSHDVTLAGCPEKALSDPLDEARKEYETEKNIKVNLRNFILQLGLSEDLASFERTHNITSPESQRKAFAGIIRTVFDESKRREGQGPK